MDESQFHAGYDPFPEPLLLQTADGGWLSNPAADSLCLSQTDFDQLARWDGSSSVWLAGRFFYVHGHRTADGLYLLLHTDAFLSSAALNLSSQLRRRLSLALVGVDTLNRHLSDDADAAKAELSSINRALFQIFRIVTELENCAEELSCHMVCLNLTDWLRRLGDETRQWCAPAQNVRLHFGLPDAPLVTMADPNLLDYMVSHLISNAIKPPRDGQKEVFLSLKKQGEQATLTVRCNSNAFSPAVLTDPLWNQPARTKVDRGLGLGFPIAQRIAALHGGALMVSPVKDGSQVVFSLPLSVPDNHLASPAPRMESTGGYSRVGIVLSDALPPAAFHPDLHPDQT